MEALIRTRKVGGSLMVHLPTEIVIEEGIKPNDLVRVDVEKVRKDWFGVFRGVGHFTEEDELTTHD